MKRDSRTAGAWLAPALLLALLAGCSPQGAAVGAAATAGVAASQEKGIGAAVDDTRIRLATSEALFRTDLDLFGDVNLQVTEGRVLLSGNVATPEDRVEAVRLAWQVTGVREVINEIAVDDTSGTLDAARDRWINLRLHAKLLLDPEVSALNYTSDTVNQVIYLMGVARDAAELDRVTRHARNLPYVRRIVSYVRVQTAAEPR